MKYYLIVFFLFSFNAFSQQDSLKSFTVDELFDRAVKSNSTIYLDESFTRNLNTSELLEYYAIYQDRSLHAGDFKKSKSHSLELLTLAQKVNDLFYQLLAAIGLMEIEFNLQNYQDCKKYYLLTKSIIKKMPDSPNKVRAGMDADYFYYLSGDFEKYVEVVQNQINHLKKINKNDLTKEDLKDVEMAISGALLFLADGYIMMGSYVKASEKLQESESIVKRIFPNKFLPYNTIKTKITKGKLLLFQKEFRKSITTFEEVLLLSEREKFDDMKYQSQVFLAMNYFNTEDYQKSLFYAESAIKASKRIADFIDFDLEANRYAFLSSKKFNLKDKSIQYADLFINENNQVKNQKRRSFVNQIIKNNYVEDVQNKKNTLKYYLLTFIIISLFSLGLVYFFQKKKIKKQYEQFQKIITELKNTKNNIAETKIELKSQKNKELSDEKLLEIIKKLEKFEKGKLFLKPEMSLAFLAGHLQTNVNTLSSIINQSKSQNFNDYINTLRINYIIEKLQNDSKYRNFKISSLAEECGFSSHSVFTVAFKKRTKMNPSQFISFLKN